MDQIELERKDGRSLSDAIKEATVQKRIDVEETNKKDIQIKREVAADSLQNLRLKVLAFQNSSDTVGELGPLQYLSGLTQTPMDKIINILLLVIIFVFDPLAIALVVAGNFAFDKARPKKNLYGELEDDVPYVEDQVKTDLPDTITPANLDMYSDEDEKRMDIIGRNGNEGEHYDESDLRDIGVKHSPVEPTEEWKITDENDKEIPEKKPHKKVARVLQKTPSKRRVKFTDGSQGWIDKDDEDKIVYL
jgi:hypothetical protein